MVHGNAMTYWRHGKNIIWVRPIIYHQVLAALAMPAQVTVTEPLPCHMPHSLLPYKTCNSHDSLTALTVRPCLLAYTGIWRQRWAISVPYWGASHQYPSPPTPLLPTAHHFSPARPCCGINTDSLYRFGAYGQLYLAGGISVLPLLGTAACSTGRNQCKMVLNVSIDSCKINDPMSLSSRAAIQQQRLFYASVISGSGKLAGRVIS